MNNSFPHYGIFALIVLSLSLGCTKPVSVPITSVSKYDTLQIKASVSYFNCNNTFSMTVYTNKGKLISDIEGAGYGNANLAMKDTVSYAVSMMDTAHNQVKPFNLLHSGDSVIVFAYVDIGATAPVGLYGYQFNLIVKSNSLYLQNETEIQPNPTLKNRNEYTYIGVMP